MQGIICIIQARTNSTRLPGKVLLKIEGKTVLEHVVERVKRSRLINEVIVATTLLPEDLRIVKLCALKGIKVYCGSEKDVLDRYYQASRLLGVNHIVRITADCPMIDPRVIDRVVRLHLKEKSDYTSNTIKEVFPDGEDVEIFTFKALKTAWQEARLPSQREHVTPYIQDNPDMFKLSNLECKQNLSKKRWTLDEPEDYQFIKRIFKALYKKNKIFGMEEVLQLLNKHPEYEKINQNIIRNEGYLKSLREDEALKSG